MTTEEKEKYLQNNYEEFWKNPSKESLYYQFMVELDGQENADLILREAFRECGIVEECPF